MPRRTLSLCLWYQGCFGSSSAAPGLDNFHFRQMPSVDSRDRRKSARRPAPLRGCQAIRQSQSSQPRTGFHCHEASGQSAGGVDFMSIRPWAGGPLFCCSVENARCSDTTAVSCLEEVAGNSHGIPIGKGTCHSGASEGGS